MSELWLFLQAIDWPTLAVCTIIVVAGFCPPSGAQHPPQNSTEQQEKSL